MESRMAQLVDPAPAAEGARPPRRRLSRRQRQRLLRGVQYFIFIAGVLPGGRRAGRGRLADAFFRLDIARSMFPNVVLVALRNTVIYTLLAFAFGLALGMVLALMPLSSVAPYRWAATGYVELFRG